MCYPHIDINIILYYSIHLPKLGVYSWLLRCTYKRHYIDWRGGLVEGGSFYENYLL